MAQYWKMFLSQVFYLPELDTCYFERHERGVLSFSVSLVFFFSFTWGYCILQRTQNSKNYLESRQQASVHAADTSVLDFLASKIGRNKFLVFINAQSVVVLSSSSTKRTCLMATDVTSPVFVERASGDLLKFTQHTVRGQGQRHDMSPVQS